MTNTLLPPIWLIILIVGLPQLTETVYTPSLPDIANSLNSSASMVEYTLTIYLFGFAVGTLFWGKLSDQLGRKPCVIAGLVVFILGCAGCYLSTTIEMLMLSRLVQAFGGSIGSVLGQAICRDSFHGPRLGKAYSSIGSALALFPSLGPVFGSLIAGQFGWYSIFLFLIGFASILAILVSIYLPETHTAENRQKISMLSIALKLITDKKVLAFGFIVAACNGIIFSFFAEGPFYLITGLGLSPALYGASFIATGISSVIGGITSRRLLNKFSSKSIMLSGLVIVVLGSGAFSLLILLHSTLWQLGEDALIITTILSQMCINLGISMVIGNALAMALVDYKNCIGTASSLFGAFYYSLISLFTLGMGILHNGTLLVMPLYFLGLGLFMLVVYKLMLRD